MKILIGYDGSESADAAIRDLVRAGLPEDVEAVVLTVAEHYVADPADSIWQDSGADFATVPHRVAELVRQSHLVTERGTQGVSELFPHWTVTGETTGTFPVPAILDRSSMWHPDLIVLGSHGRSCIGHLLLGSVSLEVLSHATCPVRIGRSRHVVDISPVRILVGTDGSQDSAHAVDLLAARSWSEGATVSVVAVMDLRQFIPSKDLAPTLLDDLFASENAERDRLQRAVDDACASLRKSGLLVQGEVVDGDPGKVLLDRAEKWGADSIVLGARGVSGLQRFVLGSVSYAVCARAHCSVEVARTAAATDDDR